MKLLRWLHARIYRLALFGLMISLILWIWMYKGLSNPPHPPRHYFNLNPNMKENYFYMEQNFEKKKREREKVQLEDKGLFKDMLEPLDHKINRPQHRVKMEAKKQQILLKVDTEVKDAVFKAALGHSADNGNNLMMGIVDMQYLEFALNFYEGSIRKLGIKYFLLICTEKAVIETLHMYNIDCFHYGISIVGGDTKNGTTFGSPAYYAKTNIKTKIMLHALTLGFNILFTDLDVVLFENPWPYLLRNLTYDLQISMDRVQWNTGFMYIRSTNASLELFTSAWKYFEQYHKSHDQAYVNMALRPMRKEKQINMLELSTRQYPNGNYYFEYDQRFFRNLPPCPECVMVHNNYLGTSAAKIYRFKENLLWNVDKNGYYSDPRAFYMTYSNPNKDFGADTWAQETQALYNAMTIAELSDRILVLPTFRCCDCKTLECGHPKHNCTLMHMLRIKAFKNRYEGKYREHVFWENSKIPSDLLNSVGKAPLLEIKLHTTGTPTGASSNTSSNVVATHFSLNCGTVPCLYDLDLKSNLKQWLRKFDDFPVIKFESLYGNLAGNVSSADAFQCSDYQQWEVEMNEIRDIL